MNAPSITLVRATRSHAGLYAEIGRTIFRAAKNKNLNVVATSRGDALTDILEKIVWIIHADSTVAGYVTCERTPEQFVYFAEVQILPEFQGKGIAPAAMREIMSGFEKQGIVCFELDVHPDNEPARKAYERLGFQKIATIANWHRTGDPRDRMRRLAARNL